MYIAMGSTLYCRNANIIMKHARSINKPAIFMDSGFLVDAYSAVLKEGWEWSFFGGRDGGMLVVVVFMSVTSVLICRRILPRFCSREFFTFCYYGGP